MTPAPAARRSVSSPDVPWVAVRMLGRLTYSALVIFHLGLLGLHLQSGRAFEPATAARWLLAILVLGGFRALSRRGLPLFSGRRAIVLWLLVVIIHCGAVWNPAGFSLEHAIPESITTLAQLSAAGVVLGAALAALLAASSSPRHDRRAASPVPALVAGLPPTGVVFRFSPRPPPLA